MLAGIAFPALQGSGAPGVEACLLRAWTEPKQRVDVTEKRGFEGGAEMGSGDTGGGLSVLYLSY